MRPSWSRIVRCTVTSRALVGSSAISSRGLHASPMAIRARWRMPPENSWGYCFARARGRSGAPPPRASRPPCRRRPCASPARARAASRRPASRSSHGVEVRHRVLRDEPDLPAADRPHLRLGCADQFPAVEGDAAAGDAAAAGEQADDRHRGRGLARAGLADDGERLAAGDLEVDALHRVHDAVGGREVDGEVPHRQQCRGVGRRARADRSHAPHPALRRRPRAFRRGQPLPSRNGPPAARATVGAWAVRPDAGDAVDRPEQRSRRDLERCTDRGRRGDVRGDLEREHRVRVPCRRRAVDARERRACGPARRRGRRASELRRPRGLRAARPEPRARRAPGADHAAARRARGGGRRHPVRETARRPLQPHRRRIPCRPARWPRRSRDSRSGAGRPLPVLGLGGAIADAVGRGRPALRAGGVPRPRVHARRERSCRGAEPVRCCTPSRSSPRARCAWCARA